MQTADKTTPTIIENWWAVLKHAWSVRLMVIAALLSGAEIAVQVMIAYAVKIPIPSGLFAALAGLVTIAATIARFVAQKKLSAP